MSLIALMGYFLVWWGLKPPGPWTWVCPGYKSSIKVLQIGIRAYKSGIKAILYSMNIFKWYQSLQSGIKPSYMWLELSMFKFPEYKSYFCEEWSWSMLHYK